MKTYDLVIIGGGPAGIIAAIGAYEKSSMDKILIIEKNNSLGKKLLLTGGGRCNITNDKPLKELLNYTSNKNFLKHAFYNLPPSKLLKLFEDYGLKFKCEDKNKIYPTTDDSNSILNILKGYLNEYKIEIKLNSIAKKISNNISNNTSNNISKNKDNLFEINIEKTVENNNTVNKNSKIFSKNLIIATGGVTYPNTGSTGDCYRIANDFNIKTTKIAPGLLPIAINNNLFKDLQGLSFSNVKVSYKSKSSNNTYSTFGNILFTHFGLSGPAILDISNYIIEESFLNRSLKSINELNFNDIFITLDFICDFNEEEIKLKFNEEFNLNGKVKIKNYLKNYLPNSFIPVFLEISNVDLDKTLANIIKKERNNIMNNLKNFKIAISSFYNKNSGIITCGGVDTKEINPKTMESKKIKGLYFVGETLDLHGPTGGYNLQIAFSTGYLAGISLKLEQ